MADTFQWERCNSTGASCVDIAGATASTYTLQAADVGSTVRARGTRSGTLVGDSGVGNPTPVVVASGGGGGGTWGAGIGLVRYGGSLAGTSHLNSYEVVIGDYGDGAVLAPLSGRTYMYTQGSGCHTAAYGTVGVTVEEATAGGWLLGTSSSYGDQAAKLGDDGYIAKFISNVKATLAAHPGVDGIFIDNCSYDLAVLYGYSSTYPNLASYNAAQLKFISTVGDSMKASGYNVMGNADAYVPSSEGAGPSAGSNDGSNWQGWWNSIGPHLTDLCMEFWQETSNGSNILRTAGTANWYNYWDQWQRLVGWAHAAGCRFFGITYSGVAGAIYGRGSMLLNAGPGDVFCWGPTPNQDPWNTSWTKNVGTPVSAVGTNPRTFTNSTITVNSSAATATIS